MHYFRNYLHTSETSAPIGALKCNFPPFSGTDRPTNIIPTDATERATDRPGHREVTPPIMQTFLKQAEWFLVFKFSTICLISWLILIILVNMFWVFIFFKYFVARCLRNKVMQNFETIQWQISRYVPRNFLSAN